MKKECPSATTPVTKEPPTLQSVLDTLAELRKELRAFQQGVLDTIEDRFAQLMDDEVTEELSGEEDTE